MEYSGPMSTPLLPAEPLLLDEPMTPWALFFGFKGRISRRSFWCYGVLALLGLGLLGTALLQIAGVRAELAEPIVNLLLAWPAIAISVKRWHDRDRSGAWVLVNLIPLVGWLWALVDNGFLRGSRGPNRFGPDPLDSADEPQPL